MIYLNHLLEAWITGTAETQSGQSVQLRRSIYRGLILSIFIVAQYIGNLGLVLGAVIGYWVDQLRF